MLTSSNSASLFEFSILKSIFAALVPEVVVPIPARVKTVVTAAPAMIWFVLVRLTKAPGNPEVVDRPI